MKHSRLPLALVILAIGCGGASESAGGPGSITSYEPAASARLDCGDSGRTAKDALRRFVSILRSGDRDRILSVLARRGRFEWISVFDSGDPIINVHDRRRKAARRIAKRGGLPLRITRFMNAEKPARTTDFGFWATWQASRDAVGKAALDCNQGAARVLSVGLSD